MHNWTAIIGHSNKLKMLYKATSSMKNLVSFFDPPGTKYNITHQVLKILIIEYGSTPYVWMV